MQLMTVAISGSHGMIGSALCRRLESQGHQIVRLIRPSGSRSAKRDPACLIWDPQAGLEEPSRLNAVDAVVHLAGVSIAARRWSDAQKRAIRQSRIGPTQKLAEQIRALSNPPAVFLSVSATGLYGDCGDRVVDEQTPPGESFLSCVARDWELAAAGLRESGVRVVHPRLGMVLSSEGGMLDRVLPLYRWMIAGRLGSGDQYWNWIALEDSLRIMEWLLAEPAAAGAFNAVSPNPLTNAEFTHILAHAVHRPTSVPVPGFALRLAMGEMADALLLCSCRAVPAKLLEAGFEFRHPDLAEFLRHELDSAHAQ